MAVGGSLGTRTLALSRAWLFFFPRNEREVAHAHVHTIDTRTKMTLRHCLHCNL